MRILISGSTGFLGTALVETLERQGHSVVRLVRPGTAQISAGGSPTQTVPWNPVAGQFDAAGAEGADALIHLAGASIAGGRWNASRKELLRTSRIAGVLGECPYEEVIHRDNMVVTTQVE